MNYNQQRSWSDKFMPSVKSILGQEIIGISTYEQDTEQATDLVILTTKAQQIACRVRNYENYKNYVKEFTIRSRSMYGKETEIHKILQGHGDWMFYGFGVNDEVIKWTIIDLHIFRDIYTNNYEAVSPVSKKNQDGTEFLIFNLCKFPAQVIVNTNIEIISEYKENA